MQHALSKMWLNEGARFSLVACLWETMHGNKHTTIIRKVRIRGKDSTARLCAYSSWSFVPSRQNSPQGLRGP